MMNSKREKILILVMQGGGTRGILQAKFLELLEKEMNTSTFELFDFFSGISIGGIHALMIAVNRSNASEIFNLYSKRTISKVFSKNSWFFLPMILSPKYKGKGKLSVLKDLFSDKTLSLAKKPVLVSAYDFIHAFSYFFSTFTQNPITLQTRVADIADATSAAPTYFPPTYSVPANTFFLDGGLIASNPAVSALIEAIKAGYAIENIKILSLGTGKDKSESIAFGKKSQKWGAVQWFTKGRLMEKIFDAPANASVHQSRILLKENFLHIPFELDTDSFPLDEVNQVALQKLVKISENQFLISRESVKKFLKWEEEPAKVDSLCKQEEQVKADSLCADPQ
ncbi:patatin-like phospholipase family protein [Candidatus Rhabdochlamydia porcellionis]|uniref:Patatin-like phospholipase n=1 Tax=Candidatus Rhabdochlamydia porcellionis TaxID=225148 RepID=A0ABX8Z0Z9_9BACT|nr:patatin-like phospholipase family protein [Candidatus Rhabdochlamydia porcellionis]QZA58568.1 Patatin-like phospholipase [Candidatus Rhabdochlamydia porcellionis]